MCVSDLTSNFERTAHPTGSALIRLSTPAKQRVLHGGATVLNGSVLYIGQLDAMNQGQYGVLSDYISSVLGPKQNKCKIKKLKLKK